MGSVFSRIVAGEIPCYKVAESEQYLAFLDVQPIAKGHVLVIPKAEVDYIFDMPPAELSGLHLFAQEVARKLKSVVPCKRIGVAVIGLEVPHAHIHLVPMNSIGDLNFSNPRLRFTPEEMEELANSIARI
jgi:histidine triad (HIT) family protein